MAENNPIEMLDSYEVRPGELAMFVGYGGHDEFNIDAFLEQYEEGKDGIGRYMEVFATHPWLPKRVLSMRVFAESELYRKACDLGSGGLSMQEVDDRVRALLKGDA